MENALAMLLAVILISVLRSLRDPNWWKERYRRKAARDSASLLARFTEWGRK